MSREQDFRIRLFHVLALAVTSQLAQLSGTAQWLVTIAIGLGCLGLGDACSRLIRKEQHAMA